MKKNDPRAGLPIDLIIALVFIVTAWLTRALGAHRFVTWDEPAWVYRSVHFLDALSRGDWAGTLLVGHPGVTTMWLGALGLAWGRWIVPTVTTADWQAVAALAALNVHDEATIRHLAAMLPAAKTFLPLAHAFLAGALWALLRKLLDRPAALAATALVVLDPYGLALSRVLHIDALTAQFMLLSCLAALAYARRPGPPARRYLLISGIAMGLAALTKSYGVLAGPVAALFLAAGWWRHRASFAATSRRDAPSESDPIPRRAAIRSGVRDIALWAIIAVTVFVVAWPAMWITPGGVLRGIMGLSIEYATRPGDATTAFFRGQVVADPGPWFYLVALWFRCTPLTVLGALLAVLGLVWPRRAPNKSGPSDAGREPGHGLALGRNSATAVLAVLAYMLFFLAIITISRKKFDRYMLPALWAGDVVAGIGLAHGLQWLWSWRQGLAARQAVATLSGAALIIVQAAAFLGPLFPSYYLAYYNPLAGGLGRAVQTIPVGWGEGMEQVAHYLAGLENAENTYVATWAVAGVAPFFPGHVAKPDAEGLANADYVALYVGDHQAGLPLAQDPGEPVFTARMNGLPYAWVYHNDYDRELASTIAGAAAPGAVILSNAASSLTRHAGNDWPSQVITGQDEAEVAQALQAAARDAPYLFYVAFDGAQEGISPLIERQLAQGALLLWQKPFLYGTLAYYRRPPGVAFAAIQPSTLAEGLFGDQLRLQGYGLSAAPAQYRQEVGVALSWRATRAPEQDYHLFLRVVDRDGRVWGARDQPLQDEAGRFSTLWNDGGDHVSRYTVPLDAGIPPGEYWISVGLYRLNDLARLEIAGDDGRSRGTELRLGPMPVTSALEPPRVEELAITHPLASPLGQAAELWGYDLDQRTYQSGEALPVTLYWRSTSKTPDRYQLALRLWRDGAMAAETQADPAGPGYPTERWAPGEVLRYPHRLLIPADLASGDYDLALNWLDAQGQDILAQDVVLARITVEHRDRLFTPPAIQHPLTLRAGKVAELLGYELTTPSGKPDEAIQLTLYWRARGPSPISYTVFVHILDAGGIVRGQVDSVPARGQRPMTGWVEGEIIVDSYDIPVASDASPGPHRIEIGLYDPANGQRLPLTEANGNSLPDRRLLIEETVSVE